MQVDQYRSLSPADQHRFQESIALEGAGYLVAAVRATIVLMQGAHLEDALRLNDGIRVMYGTMSRAQRIAYLDETESVLRDVSPVLNPSCRENTTVMAARRLQLIQRVVISGMIDGQGAVTAADLLLGNRGFGMDGNSLVMEWQNNRLQIA